MSRIKLASGDTGHTFVFQVLDLETGRPLNLSADGTAVSFHFVGVDGEVFHMNCLMVDACLGLVSVEWPAVGLLDPGLYQGHFRVVFDELKAVTLIKPIQFEVTEALPCVDGTSSPITAPARWDAVSGRLLIANADHPNVWHEISVSGDPDNPTIDIGDGEVLDGGVI